MRIAILAAVLLASCSAATPAAPDPCEELRAQGACNAHCAANFTYTNPAYGACVQDCAATYHDYSSQLTECITECCPSGACPSECVQPCQARFPPRMFPPGGCFPDGGSGDT